MDKYKIIVIKILASLNVKISSLCCVYWRPIKMHIAFKFTGFLTKKLHCNTDINVSNDILNEFESVPFFCVMWNMWNYFRKATNKKFLLGFDIVMFSIL